MFFSKMAFSVDEYQTGSGAEDLVRANVWGKQDKD